jgi:Flp pilus assembly protein TadG
MITLITSKKASQKAARCRGAVLVETAIVIVLLLMLLLGTVGFGYLFLVAEKITNAARQGARTAVRYNSTVTDVENAVADSMNPFPAIVPTYGPGGINPGPNEPVTVTIQTSGLDILKLQGILPIQDTFRASVTMAKEGP